MTPFDTLAPIWAKKLMDDLDLTLDQVAGILGNLGYESGGFAELRERGQSGISGGWGAAQWTGPRRETFLAYAQAHGLDWRSDEANYGYILVELRGAFAGMVERLRECATVEQATFLVGEEYERPGGTTATHLPGYDDRLDYARRAVEGAKAIGVLPTSTPPDTLTQTALDGAGTPPSAPYAADPRSLVMHVQSLLGVEADGIWGPETQAAYDAWREARP